MTFGDFTLEVGQEAGGIYLVVERVNDKLHTRTEITGLSRREAIGLVEAMAKVVDKCSTS